MNKIFFNGKIYTMDKNDSVVEAVYVEDGKIKKTGSNDEIFSLKKDGDKIVDLHNQTVVPGFNDSHLHMLLYGQCLNEVMLFGSKSQDEVVERGSEFLKTHELSEGQWLVGRGWNHDDFENKKMITKYDLDKISTEIPIMFSRACYHIITCNSKALKLAGITKDTKLENGEVEVIDGEMTGVLKEGAGQIVSSIINNMKRKETKNDLLAAMNKMSSFGITSVHSDDDITDGDYNVVEAYKEIEAEGKMDVRVFQQCRIYNIEGFNDFINRVYNKFEPTENYKLGSVKIWTDGSLGGRTALMNEPYSDDINTSGISTFEKNDLFDLISAAHYNNLPVAIHAIGDKAVDIAIEGIEKAKVKNPKEDMRHGIIHLQITSKEALRKIKEDNIIAFIQPIFVGTDYKIVEDRVGNRAKDSYNWKTLLDYGVKIPFSTDSPVESPNPLENIYCAVTRMDLQQKPEGGWLPEQKLTVSQAVKAYTVDSAYASYEENVKGSIEEGKFADMAVLSHNIFELHPVKIKDAYCTMTVKGGKIVYKK